MNTRMSTRVRTHTHQQEELVRTLGPLRFPRKPLEGLLPPSLGPSHHLLLLTVATAGGIASSSRADDRAAEAIAVVESPINRPGSSGSRSSSSRSSSSRSSGTSRSNSGSRSTSSVSNSSSGGSTN